MSPSEAIIQNLKDEVGGSVVNFGDVYIFVLGDILKINSGCLSLHALPSLGRGKYFITIASLLSHDNDLPKRHPSDPSSGCILPW